MRRKTDKFVRSLVESRDNNEKLHIQQAEKLSAKAWRSLADALMQVRSTGALLPDGHPQKQIIEKQADDMEKIVQNFVKATRRL